MTLFNCDDETLTVCQDTVDEVYRQRILWGQQDRPNIIEDDRYGDDVFNYSQLEEYKELSETYKKINDDRQSNSPDAPGAWADILLEEIYEALAECDNPIELRKELVQSVAVIVSWIKNLDRNAKT